MNMTSKKFKIGKTYDGEFDVLGRHVKQFPDYNITIDMHKYIKAIEPVRIADARRKQP